MTSKLVSRMVVCLTVGASLLPGTIAIAQTSANGLIEEAAPPGTNYDKAEFRFWYPQRRRNAARRLVLMPGSNGDGRAAAEDTVWQAFATRTSSRSSARGFTDKPHDQSFIEQYVNVSQGSGQALLDALDAIRDAVAASGARERAAVPVGHVGRRQFNYEFAAWKPERVAAFVVNKGGIYYSALVPPAARDVPGMLFVGGKDLEFRTNTIVGLFAVNRRGGALWALAEEPAAAHVVGRSRDVAMVFFEDILPLRLGDQQGRSSRSTAKSGFIGDFKAKTFQPIGEPAPGFRPRGCLPSGSRGPGRHCDRKAVW